jgi:2,3-bisphosphoglycerate-dependent phosphoglycerate mutase
MKNLCYFLFFAGLLLNSCQMETPVIRAFNEGNMVTTDGKNIPIKGYGSADAVTFFIVRHAEQEGNNMDDPPLTEAGKQRAARLAEVMSGVPVSLSTSTNYLRTTETANPFVFKNKGDISVYDPDNMTDHFEEILKTRKGKNVFVIGHSNSIPALLNLFSGKEVYKDIPETEYNNMYIAVVKSMGDVKVTPVIYE